MLKIKNLKIQNLKNVKTLEVSFDDNFTTIAGNNGAGKSTIIDAIRFAIQGKTYFGKGRTIEANITHGETKAEVEVKLGNSEKTLKINRTIKENGVVELTVKSSDVDDDKIGQKELDNLLSVFTIDPLAFNKMSKKEQFETMKSITGLDFTELDNQKAIIYEERTFVNRKVKEINGAISEMGEIEKVEPVDFADISNKLQNAIQHNQNITNSELEISDIQKGIYTKEQKVADLYKQASELEDIVNTEKEQLRLAKGKLSVIEKIDTAILQEQLVNATSQNTKYDNYKKYIDLKNNLLQEQQNTDKLSNKIDEIDKQKAEQLTTAKLPLPNMIFNEVDGIIINGIALDQYSTAQQMIIASKIATSVNSEMKVIYIKDGSLLDTKLFAELEQFAIDNDYQILCERVGEDNFAEIKMRDGEKIEKFE